MTNDKISQYLQYSAYQGYDGENIILYIGERKFLFRKEDFDEDKCISSSFGFKESYSLSFSIGCCLNLSIKVSRLNFSGSERKITSIDIDGGQRIDFSINGCHQYIETHKGLNIKFPCDNSDCFSFTGEAMVFLTLQSQDLKLQLTNMELYSDGESLKKVILAEDIDGYFFYNGKKYKLLFKVGEEIYFDARGNILQKSINNSDERMNQIEEQDRIYNLEKATTTLKNEQKKLADKQAVATREDWCFIISCAVIGLLFVFVALSLCFNMTFNYNLLFLNLAHETFNKYTFLYEILKRTPIIILIISGFKFLQLAFVKLRQIGEVEKVRDYLKLTTDDDTKKQLLKMIAVPFFAPKKVKSGFFDELIKKLSFEPNVNLNNQPKDGGNKGP